MNKKSLMQKIQNQAKKTKPFAITALFGALMLYGKTIDADNIRLENPFLTQAFAQTALCTPDTARMAALKDTAAGFFKNTRFAEKPFSANALSFKDTEGKERTLADLNGKILLVNLWATWCNPCRVEMPELAHLKNVLEGDDFDVIAINIDKAPDKKVTDFLRSVKADNLKLYRDQSMKIFQDIRREGLAIGLPVTLLLDEKGCLLASYNGAAPWGNDDAQALIKAAIATKN